MARKRIQLQVDMYWPFEFTQISIYPPPTEWWPWVLLVFPDSPFFNLWRGSRLSVFFRVASGSHWASDWP